MWKLALRNIFRHRSRTLLTLGAIAFGVAALIVSTGFVNNFLLQLREATIHSQFGHLQVFKFGYFKLGNRAPYDYMIDDPAAKISELGQLEYVTDIAARVKFSGLLSNGRTTYPIVGEGIDPDKEKHLSNYMRFTAGTGLAHNDRYTVILGQGVASALNLKVGDSIALLVNTRGGALNTLDLRIVGVFQTFSKEFDERAIRIPLSTAQELLATQAVHSLVFLLDDTNRTDEVAQQIMQHLPKNEYEVRTWYELADFYQKTVDLYQRYFYVLYLIILGLVLLSVANNINMTIYERTGEFGTLMALGNRRGSVFRLILAETFLLGLFGSIAGLLLGASVAAIISLVGIPMPPMPNTNAGYTAYISIVPAEAFKSLAIGLGGSIVAALWPARKASTRTVAEALRHN